MKLKQFLNLKGITIRIFCLKHLEVSTTYFYGVLNGRLPLSDRLSRRVEKITNGKISATDFEQSVQEYINDKKEKE